MRKLAVITLSLLLGAGCSHQKPPYVRFATASKAEMDAAQSADVVWYEFQTGDAVPLNIGVLGNAEAIAEGMTLVAKKPFYIVVYRGRPPMLSFDGENVHHRGSQAFLAFGHRDGKNELTVLTYVGLPEEMPVELKDKSP